jgi:hypothetical protein
MTQRHRRRTLALIDLARDRDRGHGSMVPLLVATSVALLALVLLVPVVTVVGALLGFMAAAHLG